VSADVIYISYDGMTDPLGRSQVLPYLTGLAALGHRIRLVSLEKAALIASGLEAVRKICGDAAIEWHPLHYRSRPPIVSAMINVAALRREARRLHRDRPADFTHCRSDLAGMAGLALKRRSGVPMLYDMRAFWPDERAEGGAWDQSKALYRALFRYFKARQQELIANADEIVMLAEEGRQALTEIGPMPQAPVTVIACCADFDHFTLSSAGTRGERRAELGLGAGTPLLIHLGSIGCNVLLGEMLDFLVTYRQRYPAAQMLFLTPQGAEAIFAAARERGLEEAVRVRSAAREEVPHWLAAADLGLFFVRPVFSKKAASPTKLGEMLAVGLPVVTNSGIGDVAAIVRDLRAGVVVPSFDTAAYRDAIEQLARLRINPQQLREGARRWFDVRGGISTYDGIYRRMTAGAVRG
jgi:glycosyltransferase involved in cell wall biosynthesis